MHRLLIVAVVVALFFTNYVPGTWLTGWDNLHPEFDFKTNIIERSLVSVWQEYQGLGLQAGNAHAADLVRQLGMYLLSFFLAPNILRYVYHFVALFIGGIGIYELLKRKVLPANHAVFVSVASLVGAGFYILNLGTLQNFTLPYEAFSHFFASLPWLILGILLYIDHPTKKKLFILSLFNLLATPAFYIPTIFVVYLMIIFIIFLYHILSTKSLKNVSITLSIIFLINAFWLLPFLGFVAKGTSFVSQVKINRMFTDEAFLRNQEFGTIGNIALLKGFLFDTTDLVDTTDKHDFVMRPWMDYLIQPIPTAIYYLFFVIILGGYAWALLTKKSKGALFLGLFVLAFIALINDNPPTGWLFGTLQATVPFFKQIFRFPFTKFIVLASLAYAIGLSYGIYFLCTKIQKLSKGTWSTLTLLGISFFLLITTNLPSFTGHFFYAPLKQLLPAEYNEVFKFLQSEPPEGRIANLPQPSYWGWTAYDWGYRGSGFPWYGIPQPILDRAFDVWNPNNEIYYRDLANALYTQQSALALESVFEKYHIRYAWIDNRVIFPGKESLLYLPETKKIIESSSKFTKLLTAGRQSIYGFSLPNSKNAVSIAQYGTLKLYPFGDLQNTTRKSRINQTNDAVEIVTPIQAGSLTIPSFDGTSGKTLYHAVLGNDKISFTPLLPVVFLNNEKIPVPDSSFSVPVEGANAIVNINGTITSVEKPTSIILSHDNNTITTYPSRPVTQNDIVKNLFALPIRNCSDSRPSPITEFTKIIDQINGLQLTGRDSHPCLYSRIVDLIPNLALQHTSNGLLGLHLTYQSQTKEKITVCLTQEEEASCFYQADLSGSPDNQSAHADLFVPLDGRDIRKIWIKLELAADASDKNQNVKLESFTVDLYPSLNTSTFASPTTTQDLTLNIPTSSEFSIRFPQQEYPRSTIYPGAINKTKQNCFSLGNGTFTRDIDSDLELGSFVRYGAHNASSCDSFTIHNSNFATGTITSFITRNISGRPIKACVAMDPPGYCLFEDILFGTTKDWTTTSYVTPEISTLLPYTYYINLDDYAVGQERRVNDIASISLTSIPHTWLQSITLIPNQPNAGNEEVIPLTIMNNEVNVNRWNPTMYGVSLKKSLTSLNLVLYQSFDPGWKAYEIECRDSSFECRVKTFLPFLFGTEIKDHVMVNNWANGWMLREPTTYNLQQTTIILFFLPQLLQWIGFLLLPVPFIWILIKKS